MYWLGLSSITLHFDLMLFSIMVSVYYKEKFLYEDKELHLYVGITTNI